MSAAPEVRLEMMSLSRSERLVVALASISASYRVTPAPISAGLNYNTLKHRLESAHSAVEAAAVEARRRVRLHLYRGAVA
jgi:hypothetical protein